MDIDYCKQTLFIAIRFELVAKELVQIEFLLELTQSPNYYHYT